MSLARQLSVALGLLAAPSLGQFPEDLTEAGLMTAIAQQDIDSVEDFVAALPGLHKRHFIVLHQSDSPARSLVNAQSPRVVSWGADARFILAWIMDSGSTQVEFIRQARDRWVAGVIEFSGDEPALSHPADCARCHGALDRPIWGGIEFDGTASSTEGATADSANGQREADLRAFMLSTTNPRLSPLERSSYSGPVRRALRIGGMPVPDAANWNLSVLLALRHGEVLFQRLKARPDYEDLVREGLKGHRVDQQDQFGEYRAVSDAWTHAFPVADRFLHTLVDTGASVMGDSDGNHSWGWYTGNGPNAGQVVAFLVYWDLYSRYPGVKDLYRKTSNAGMLTWRPSPDDGLLEVIRQRLLYPYGGATAEQEMVAAHREFFELTGADYLTQAIRREKSSDPGGAGGRIRYNAEFIAMHIDVFRAPIREALKTGVNPPPPSPPPPGPPPPSPPPPGPPPPGPPPPGPPPPSPPPPGPPPPGPPPPGPPPPSPPPPGPPPPSPPPPGPPPPGPPPPSPPPPGPPPPGPPPPSPPPPSPPPPSPPPPGPPSVAFTVNGGASCAGALCRARAGVPVIFKDESTGGIGRWRWDFGDGSSSRTTSPRHAWSEPGFFEVRLRVGYGDDESVEKRMFLVEAANPAGTCEPDAETACLRDSRYAVSVVWQSADAEARPGLVVHAGTNDSGLFRFFAPDNWEVLVKVLSGCRLNGHDWVFVAASTNLAFEIRVTDTATGVARRYRNEGGAGAAAVTDLAAFACDPP